MPELRDGDAGGIVIPSSHYGGEEALLFRSLGGGGSLTAGSRAKNVLIGHNGVSELSKEE